MLCIEKIDMHNTYVTEHYIRRHQPLTNHDGGGGPAIYNLFYICIDILIYKHAPLTVKDYTRRYTSWSNLEPLDKCDQCI